MAQRVYVSIGSNMNPGHYVPRAVNDIRQMFGQLTVSPVYRSRAVGFEGDDFYNLVVGFLTAVPPMELANALRTLESIHGRVRGGGKFTPRTLDLDVLTYGNQIISDGRLVLPRDEITRYAFVLRPLAELAPDEVHPELGRTYAELWAAFDASGESMTPIDLDLELEPEGGPEADHGP